MRAQLRADLGDLAGAAEDLEAALRVAPKHPEYLKALTEIRARLKKPWLRGRVETRGDPILGSPHLFVAKSGDRFIICLRMDTEGVQRLFLRHAGLLKGFILALVPDRNAAEDVFQEVFLTASVKASEFRDGTDFPAWTRAIARFKVLEHYRSGRGSPAPLELGLLEQLADDAPLESTGDWERRRVALDDCLKSVAPRAREVMGLRYGEGLLPPRIARRMAWSVSAVHVALSRVRKFLRECAQRKLATGGR